jgi:hypothetical protein
MARGAVPGAIEAEGLTAKASAGEVHAQDMKPFLAGRWSAGAQLFWRGAKPGDRLELTASVPKAGDYDIEIVFTKARDYATVKLSLGDRTLGDEIDLYSYPDVITSGVLTYEKQPLSAGDAKLTIEIVGAHPSATPAHFVGIDYVRFVKAD